MFVRSKKIKLLSSLALFFAAAAFAAPDEELLGKAEGYPVCAPSQFAPLPQRCLVGLLSNFDQVAPARTVAKSTAPRALKRPDKPYELRYVHRERQRDLESFLAEHRNTGLLVMKDDTVLVERYQYERKPEHRFQSYSMAKTVVAMLVGIAIHERKISSIDDRADKYLAELKDHPYGETSLRHLLTMSSGVKFTENYDGKDDVMVLSRRAIFREGPGGVHTVLPFTERARPAGEKFYYEIGRAHV